MDRQYRKRVAAAVGKGSGGRNLQQLKGQEVADGTGSTGRDLQQLK